MHLFSRIHAREEILVEVLQGSFPGPGTAPTRHLPCLVIHGDLGLEVEQVADAALQGEGPATMRVIASSRGTTVAISSPDGAVPPVPEHGMSI